jgi:hypothetical protein
MIKNKRSSEILEECLNLVFTGQETVESALARHPEYADQLRPELEAALWLHQRRSVTGIRPGYVAASRQRLVNQISQANQKTVQDKKTIFAWKPAVFRLAFILLFLVVAGFAFSGGAQFVNASLPGDQLYDLKLAAEDVQLSLASSPVAKAELRIELADKRAREVESLLAAKRYEDAEVGLAAYRENLSIASDLITNLDDPENEVALARKLATTASRNGESFTMIVAAGGMPSHIVAAMGTTISLNDEVTFTMMVVMGVNEDLPLEATETPTATMTPTATATSTATFTFTPTPSETSTPTATLEPSITLEPTETLGVTATVAPSNTPRPPAPTDDDGDREPAPTQKPTNTPKPKKPTKTPKDK